MDFKYIGGSGMIKTIKVKKEMNFRELMEYILENDIRDRVFRCSIDDHVFRVCEEGIFEFYCENYDMGETYEIEVEEEIMEDTEFEQVLINTHSFLHMRYHYSIERVFHDFGGVQEIFARIDGKLQKIWERE